MISRPGPKITPSFFIQITILPWGGADKILTSIAVDCVPYTWVSRDKVGVSFVAANRLKTSNLEQCDYLNRFIVKVLSSKQASVECKCDLFCINTKAKQPLR